MEMEGYAADIKSARSRLRDMEKIMGGLRVVAEDGSMSADPRIIKFMVSRKSVLHTRALPSRLPSRPRD